MKINISLFVISLALAGCAAQPAKNLDAPVTVKTTTEGQFVLAAAQAGKLRLPLKTGVLNPC